MNLEVRKGIEGSGLVSSPSIRRSPASTDLKGFASSLDLNGIDPRIRSVSSGLFNFYDFKSNSSSTLIGPSPQGPQDLFLGKDPELSVFEEKSLRFCGNKEEKEEDNEIGLELEYFAQIIKPSLEPKAKIVNSEIDLLLSSEQERVLPVSKEYPSLLRASNVKNKDSNQILQLFHGEISEREFIAMPLFASTIEKHEVFGDLCKLSKDPAFKVEYGRFLYSIQNHNQDWAHMSRSTPIRKQPKYLAYLSLFAYLNNKITEEELVIAHTLASCMEDDQNNTRYTVLTQDTLEDYLKRYNYLREDESITSFPSLLNFDRRSVIERTAISYYTKSGIDLAFYQEISKWQPKWFGFFSFPDSMKKGCSVSILPLGVLFKFYEEQFTQSLNDHDTHPPTKHAAIFGYRKDVNDLVKGRPITYSSPLFKGPKEVHDIESTQVGIFVHDILAHCIVDWMHPYANNLINAGKEILELGGEQRDEELKILGIEILDRAVLPETSSMEKNVALFLKRAIEGKSKETIQIFHGVIMEHIPFDVLCNLDD